MQKMVATVIVAPLHFAIFVILGSDETPRGKSAADRAARRFR